MPSRIATSLTMIRAVLILFMLGTIGCDPSSTSVAPDGALDTTLLDDQADFQQEHSDSESESVPGAEPSAEVEDVSSELAVGVMAPDFEVEALGGASLRLSRFVREASGPTVLLFDRAHW